MVQNIRGVGASSPQLLLSDTDSPLRVDLPSSFESADLERRWQTACSSDKGLWKLN
jgi:hypothetical protein